LASWAETKVDRIDAQERQLMKDIMLAMVT
jgi:hypothetical protein